MPRPLTWIEISARALSRNVRTVKKRIGNRTLYAVVKSNAYGHGLGEVVRVLDRERAVDAFAVAGLDEALQVRKLTAKPILILNFWQRDSRLVRRALRAGIRFAVFDVSSARWLSHQAHALQVKAYIHLKIDVGTLRLGARYDQLEKLIPMLTLPGLVVEGVFSHFADSESANEQFTRLQEARFEKSCDFFEARGYQFRKHIACSAASLRSNMFLADGIRLGISLYGLFPSPEIRTRLSKSISLEPALTWKTRILQVKDVKPGETIGYGRSYRSKHVARLAVLPIGYWDGYDRRLSNKGSVVIGGVRCPVRGRICMNVTMVELPQRSTAGPGDEVVLIGRQGSVEITADEVARLCGTIHYEIVARLHPLIVRQLKPHV